MNTNQRGQLLFLSHQRRLALISVPILLVSIAFADEPLQRFSRTERHMGADFTIKLYAADDETGEQALKTAFAVVAEYDKLMSDYNAESELSQLSQKSPTRSPQKVSRPIFDVLSRASDISDKTDGAFDVTVGPLTKLWRRAKRQKELPEADELKTSLAAVGWKKVQLDKDQQTVALVKPGMRLDLGGIAPGYAADQVLALLRERGIKSALADASGDVALGDPPPGEAGWKVGLASLKADGPPERFVTLANCAIATSGDAFRGVEIGGVRYSHIVDPKTGVGLKHRSSVTVLAHDCTTADALATAVSVLGPEKGLGALAKFKDAQARIVWQDEQGEVHSMESDGFPR
jgi:thiamine biosynthesis lipoprotein